MPAQSLYLLERTMKEIAISGSHGFLGQRLLEHLGPSKVIRLDRTPNVPDDVKIVFDLATYGNMYEQTDFRKIYRANFTRVAEMLQKLPPDRRFIYVSTSSVKLPVQTHYSVSKRTTEGFLKALDNNYAIVRPYSVTGVGEQPAHLIPKLIDSCLNGTEMPFVPDPVHDFIDVDDFVDALLILSKSKEKGIFEVGGGVEHSNQDVLEIVERVTGKKANVIVVPTLRSYDTGEWRSNNERMYSLGWEPKKSLTETITEMCNA